MPSPILDGVVPSNVILLPVAFYSHLCGGEFEDTVPAYINYLAELTNSNKLTMNNSVRFDLEALADVMEATVCNHVSVQQFKKDGTPVINTLIDPLAQKFSIAAEEGVKSMAKSYFPIIQAGDWQTFLSLQQEHLQSLFGQFAQAKVGNPSLLVYAAAPSLSKRRTLFNHVLKQKDWLQIKPVVSHVWKPSSQK
ncbi:MAG: hypothetical protein UR68_C0003G0053 [Candidatus Roizmanbacteria bacterium GW2011_GWA2_35_19]|uniref:Uncharacterized protein n=2 Tax=Candidatus Roizmaniibacteriota TaxID=1752723 RepID=A0A0G0BWZ5_9BACT|nr:MAG: hypothetical protein UR63_C0008G0022 [Candidatus Roizmanbacteria bacterium GW2011_GWC2_35_12]KKP73758.1 MAG: hypothetical protein UR68_C0003G0053 [Candidatus Roizmanbacteria bacterium GW2011_GWA2_35_19]